MKINIDDFIKPNFKILSEEFPEFKKYIYINKYGGYSINWKNSNSIKELVKTILNKYFNITYYEIPENFLIPTLTSRYNYLNYINKLFTKLKIENKEKILIDIGTGANIIYPLLGLLHGNIAEPTFCLVYIIATLITAILFVAKIKIPKLKGIAYVIVPILALLLGILLVVIR